MLSKPRWWITLLLFISVNLAGVSLIFGNTNLTQIFSGGHGVLCSPLLLLLNPILHWPSVWSHSEADEDINLVLKLAGGKILFSVLSQVTIQTTALEKLNTIRAASGLETASRQPLWHAFKIPIKASPSRLNPCSFLLITHTALHFLSTQQKQSLRVVSFTLLPL